MAIELVDFPIKNGDFGDFPLQTVSLPEGIPTIAIKSFNGLWAHEISIKIPLKKSIKSLSNPNQSPPK